MPTPDNRTTLACERLEDRRLPTAAALAGGTLTVTGTPGDDRIRVVSQGGVLRVFDGTAEVGAFASAAVKDVTVRAGGGNDAVTIEKTISQPTTLNGGAGNDKLTAGAGPATLNGGVGSDALVGGFAGNVFNGGGGGDRLFRVSPGDVVVPNPGDRTLAENPPPAAVDPLAPGQPQQVLTRGEVDILLKRAAAASSSSDAIIAVVDRNGRILGVRVEGRVATEITGTGNNANLVFAVDGAVAKARTGAFFGNNQGPLTSRTVQFISQSTITEREVNSNPNVTDPNSTVRGPGFVAPVGIKGHFPPNVINTPQVDLFQIEHTNRDGTFAPGPDRIKGTDDDVKLDQRFNLNANFVPDGKELAQIDSYGFESRLLPGAQSRGIATLPGGIPIYKNGQVAGGIGVFFPGKTGYATEENSSLSTTFDPMKPDRSLEAEWIAFAAVGGYDRVFPVGPLDGVALPGGIRGIPFGRIDLVGITLDIVGPGGPRGGLDLIAQVGATVGRGNPNDGGNRLVSAGLDGQPNTTDDVRVRGGRPVPDGWLVNPHDGDGIKREDVIRIITAGIQQANATRAAIRLPLGSRTRMVFAVADRQGNIVGLYRMPDATVFSIDVAVAKARNVAYYANPTQLQAIDQIPGVAPGTAFTNRTFRFAGEPRFPEGIDGAPPGPFSQLNDGGADPFTGRQVGPRLPASAYQSVVGYDAFNPGTNFRNPYNRENQNGIVFFPGSAPLYKTERSGSLAVLAGGFGVSGDGVDQDDVVTFTGQGGYNVPPYILRADQVFFRGVRLPYQKFNRNPEG